MVWDPTKPAEGAALVSAPVRENFQALDALMGNGGMIPAYPLLAPDGLVDAASYAFAADPTLGMSRSPVWGTLRFTGGIPSPGAVRIPGLSRFGLAPRATPFLGTSVEFMGEYLDEDNYSVLGIVVQPGGAIIGAASYGTAGPTMLMLHGQDTIQMLTAREPTPVWEFRAGYAGPSSFLPDSVVDLGDATHRIRDLYVGRQFYLGTGLTLTALASAPPTPPSGLGVVYVKASDKKMYFKNDAGVETPLW